MTFMKVIKYWFHFSYLRWYYISKMFFNFLKFALHCIILFIVYYLLIIIMRIKLLRLINIFYFDPLFYFKNKYIYIIVYMLFKFMTELSVIYHFPILLQWLFYYFLSIYQNHLIYHLSNHLCKLYPHSK